MAKPSAPKPQSNNNQTLTAQQWSGPLPPPAALEQFDHLIDNGAERIMQMVEREQSHRMDQEREMLSATIKDTRRGHFLGAAISILALIGAGLTAYWDAHPSVSIAFLSLPVVTIVQAIIRSRSNGD